MKQPREQAFTYVRFPQSDTPEAVPTHALGKQIKRMNQVFSLIGSQIELTLKVVPMSKPAGARKRKISAAGLKAMQRSAALARAAKAKNIRLAKAARRSKRAPKTAAAS